VTDPHQDKNNDKGAIDMRVIADLRELGGDDDPGLLAELIELFLSDAPARIRELETGLASGEIKLVERAAHTLKSSSANIGALNLSALCKRIEELARNQQKDAIKSLVADTTKSFSEAEAVLQSLKP
jgi:HPt (histidine-containing phosphotransfer) domain-containing protein